MSLDGFSDDLEFLLLQKGPEDPDLRRHLKRLCRPYLAHLARFLTPEAREADQVVRKSVAALDRRLARYPLGADFRVWLTRLALGTWRHHRRFSRLARLLPWRSPPPPASNLPTPGLEPSLYGKLFRLEPQPRLALGLRYGLGLSVSQIREVLGGREETVLAALDQACQGLIPADQGDWFSHTHPETRHALYRLEVDQDKKLEAHLRSCKPCQRYWQWLQELATRLGTRPEDEMSGLLTQEQAEALAIPGESRTPTTVPFSRVSKEILWILAGVGLILLVGWWINRVNPSAEVEAALRAAPQEVSEAPLEDSPNRSASMPPVYESNRNGSLSIEGSWTPRISLDGRWIAFASSLRRLVDQDSNNVSDIFVLDRQDGSVERVSVDSQGRQANQGSFEPSISGDGRFVAFTSWASNLVPGDTLTCTYLSGGQASCPDVFVHDRVTGKTELVSVTPEGKPGNDFSFSPVISADGRWVAFWSQAGDLVPGDDQVCDEGHSCLDIFIRDRLAGTTDRIPVGRRAGEWVGDLALAITDDGRLVLFKARPEDELASTVKLNNPWDLYLYDRITKTYEPVNVDARGNPGNAPSLAASLTPDGHWLAFSSAASNLVADDTNQKIDVFVRDRIEGTLTRVSVSPEGVQGDGDSGSIWDPSVDGGWLAISADGRRVMFISSAENLVEKPERLCGHGALCLHLYLADLEAGEAGPRVQEVTVVDETFFPPSISLSADGKWATTMGLSKSCNPNEFCTDIYLYDLSVGQSYPLGSYGLRQLSGQLLTPRQEDELTLMVHDNWVTSVAFSPLGDLLASGSRDGTIQLITPTSGEVLKTLDAQTGGVNSLVFSPDGGTLAAGAESGQVFLWRVPAGNLIGVLDHNQGVRSLDYSPDGSLVGTNPCPTPPRPQPCLNFSPKESLLAIATPRVVRLWDTREQVYLRDISLPEGTITTVAFSPDGKLLAVGSTDGTVWLLHIPAARVALRLGGHEAEVTALAFSPDGTRLATASRDDRVHVWLLAGAQGTLEADLRLELVHNDWVSSLAFSPDGQYLVSGSFDSSVGIWDLDQGELVAIPFRQPQSQVLSVGLSPDGKRLAAGTVRGEVHLWQDFTQLLSQGIEP